MDKEKNVDHIYYLLIKYFNINEPEVLRGRQIHFV